MHLITASLLSRPVPEQSRHPSSVDDSHGHVHPPSQITRNVVGNTTSDESPLSKIRKRYRRLLHCKTTSVTGRRRSLQFKKSCRSNSFCSASSSGSSTAGKASTHHQASTTNNNTNNNSNNNKNNNGGNNNLRNNNTFWFYFGCFSFKGLALVLVIPLSVWLGLSSYAYDRIHLAGKERSYCWMDGLYDPSIKFVPMADCAECIQNTTVGQRYAVPDDRIEQVEFWPRDDHHWHLSKMSKLHAWVFNRDNFTSAPTVIVVHGIRSCRKGCSAMVASGMLYHSGYNVLALDLRNHGSSPHFDLPYATFGHQEFRDVLGAVDYLRDTYGERVVQNLGLMGMSMGGAVSLIAYEREPLFKALFLDSPACDVYGTLKYGIERVLKSFGHGILKGTCLLRGYTHGCAPFQNDPLDSASRVINRPVHFDHCATDTVVPEFSTRNCFAALKKVNPSTAHLSKFIGPTSVASPACSDHLILMLSESDEYQKRLVSFFDTHLSKPVIQEA